jgi:hypothetical protein
MADDDIGGASAGLDDDFGLPKATVNKMIQEMMPADIGCAKDTKDLIAECCVGKFKRFSIDFKGLELTI